MKFQFAIATDITEYAKKHFSDKYNEYEKVYITPDTNDYHILRILYGYGEDYEPDCNSYVLEWNKIPKSKQEKISSLNKLKKILEEDDLGNWDYKLYDTIEKCIENIDGGFGIN